MVELLRADTDAFGLVTGNGGYAQKHSAGLYSCQQPQRLFELPDLEELQESVNMLAVEPVQTAPEVSERVFLKGFQCSARRRTICVRTISFCGSLGQPILP